MVERNRPFTQALAARIYAMGHYNGIRWWSFHRPHWRVYCLWEIDPYVVQVEPLSTGHIAVVDAAVTLTKAIAWPRRPQLGSQKEARKVQSSPRETGAIRESVGHTEKATSSATPVSRVSDNFRRLTHIVLVNDSRFLRVSGAHVDDAPFSRRR